MCNKHMVSFHRVPRDILARLEVFELSENDTKLTSSACSRYFPDGNVKKGSSKTIGEPL